jgi:predicted Zn-dependent protease with MMP-like domain
MKVMFSMFLFCFLYACSWTDYTKLCSDGESCVKDLDKTLEDFATREGNVLTLMNGRKITVDVFYAGLILGPSDDVWDINAGLCGVWHENQNKIVISRSPKCGDLDAILLHEIGHAYGLSHGSGIMYHSYQGPLTKKDIADLYSAINSKILNEK